MAETLPEFLLRCIGEDEAVAREHDEWRRVVGSEDWWPTARVLAECEAKRRIVELHEVAPVRRSTMSFVIVDGKRQDAYVGGGCYRCYEGDGCSSTTGSPGWCETLEALALPYADRPGYREEWKP